MKHRLDKLLVQRGLAPTRSQAEHLVALGKVQVSGRRATKSGQLVDELAEVRVTSTERYVSRAGLKLSSVAAALGLDFSGQTVLDVGSSTGGFTDYALQNGASKVYAVDVGTDQMHPSLRHDPRIELHEKTDIRDFTPPRPVDIVVIDVSFISLRHILPSVVKLVGASASIIAMVKPQFEADKPQLTKAGIVKNDRMRRDILRSFELWTKSHFLIQDKADSEVAGTHGNRERFYLLQPL